MFLTARDLRTQKAQGLVLWHMDKFMLLREIGVLKSPKNTIVSVWPHDPIPSADRYPLYGRPCPVTPRHGFVDSENVHGTIDAKAITKATEKEEPDGEVMFMPRLSGCFSAVVNNAGVTWGRGNDGATSGRGGGVTIPAYTSAKRWNRVIAPTLGLDGPYHGFANGISEDSSFFLELVEHKGSMELVQVRTGPAIPGIRDFVPSTMKVKHILTLKEGGPYTLLEWEKLIHSCKPGSVFVFRSGSLASHYAVHAIQNGIPVICSRRLVKVGCDLAPRASCPRQPSQKELDSFAHSLCTLHGRPWRSYWPHTMPFGPENINAGCREMALLGIGVTHASSLWGWQGNLIDLRAMGIIGTIRLILMACIGEGRHFYGNGPGRNRQGVEPDESSVPWQWLYSGREYHNMKCRREDTGPPSRDATYDTLLTFKMEDVVALGRMVEKDLNLAWGSGSFGGPKWANACTTALGLYSAVIEFLESSSLTTLTALMEQLNITIHTVHNGGAVLSKWVPQRHFNMIAGREADDHGVSMTTPVLPLAFMSSLVGGIAALGIVHQGNLPNLIAENHAELLDTIFSMKHAVSGDLESLTKEFE